MTVAAFFPSPQLQNTAATATRATPSHRKSQHQQPHHQNLHFLFIPAPTFLSSLPSSSSSSSFPLTIKSSSSSTSRTQQFHVVSDSIHNNVIQDLEESLTNSHSHLNGVRQLDHPNQPSKIFIRDPPWISSIFLKGLCKNTNLEFKLLFKEIEKNKYNLLRRRQIQAETEAWERMVEEYRELERVMCEKNLAPNLPHVKALFLGWFEPLKEAIEAEQKSQKTKKHKTAFAPHIESLPAAKMAVIVMHKMMGLVAMEHHQAGCVVLVNAAVQIGMAIEQEVRVQKFMEKTRSHQRKKTEADTEDDMNDDKPKLMKHINGLIKKRRLRSVQKLLKKEDFVPWGRDTQAKLGSRLIDMLIGTAYVHIPVSQSADTPPDFRPAFRHRFKAISKNPGEKILKNYGIIECDPLVLAGLDKSAHHMLMPYMPMLIPPKKWKGYEKGGHLFLPSYIMRTHGSKKQQDTMKNVKRTQMQKVFEALDVLGSTKWRINRRILAVVEAVWAGGGNTAGLIDRKDVPIPARPPLDDPKQIQEWKWNVMKAKKINAERHSLRCDTELKLSVARKMKDEEGFYYPHNLDFRGRAYPMHSHLNHLSCDLCRGLLEFAEGKPLGKSGLQWLKIHLANLYAGGVEKLSYDGRLTFVENHLHDIFDSADNPVNGNRWWLMAEDPFQCLATCINLSEALRSSSPSSFISHLPIHQDGSCNGLQHYAALGRDTMEAAAVNLVAKEKPADVYSEIAVRVHDIMRRDCKKDPSTYPNALLAKVLIDQIDRKLVKQTVMTSVYGVTFVGAREQIKRRLEEKGLITDDKLLFAAACYAAKVTLKALEEIFGAARDIMGWLGDCAKVIASENEAVRWTTPLGLPVVQPYCRNERHLVRTSLQILALKREGNTVDAKKQRTAFPPNFVHSLDGSHMMMTALACRDAGLCFAGVHDSFWTHACDVENMSQILREKFVELYDMPILENLLEDFGQVKEKSKWFSSLRDLMRKLKIMKMEHIKLLEEAEAYRKCQAEISKMGLMINGKLNEQQESHEDLKFKYIEGEKERKELYNKVLELRGNIRVFCRCRPLNAEELAAGATMAIDFESAKDGELTVMSNGAPRKTFKFDAVFGPQAEQADIFEDTAPFATSVLDGYNVCIFAYGQTGTGKTFTMEGTEEARGVNFRTLEKMFDIIRERQTHYSYDVSVSVLEVYNEQIRDLLFSGNQPGATARRLEIRQAGEGMHHVPGLVEAHVNNMSEVWEVLQTGSNARAVSSTNANEHSSRSHCIHCVMVKGENVLNGECTRSKLWLVDLAGSERVAKTDVQGDRLKEAQNINRSLSALGDVISALATKSPHIPFRNSKLTHLLQDSLGGDSKALMFVQISPNETDLGETVCSLNFASRARGIELGPAKKQLDTVELLRHKQMAEKTKQEAKLKEFQLKKMEETIHVLESKMKERDNKNKSLHDKVKELEAQLLIERKLARQHVDSKIAEQHQMKQQEEPNSALPRPSLVNRPLSINKNFNDPVSGGWCKDQVNSAKPLTENNFLKPLIPFSTIENSIKCIDHAEKENNPEMAEKLLLPKRSGRASICTMTPRVPSAIAARRNSLIPLPSIPSLTQFQSPLLPIAANQATDHKDVNRELDTKFVLAEQTQCESPKEVRSGVKKIGSILRRSLHKKIQVKSPQMRRVGVNVGMEKVRVSIGSRGRLGQRVQVGSARRGKEIQQKNSQKEKERGWI